MSTSKLQRQTSQLISELFGQYTIHENYRPSWLDRLELDLFIEEIALAVEVQGRQHLEHIPHFHSTYAEFQRQQKRDELKRHACETQGVTLIEIFSQADFVTIQEKVEARRTLDEKWNAADRKRKKLERLLDPRARTIVKRLSILYKRLERWRQKTPSEKRTYVLRSIEGQLKVENKRLLDETEILS